MIAVIVLNWNNSQDTCECLASVYSSNDPCYSVYVVDNGSTDSSLSEIKDTFPQAIFLEMKENLGFAEGNNHAIRRAMQDGAEYLFLLNNDAVIAKNTLSIFRQAADRYPNAGALGATIYYYDDPTTIWYAGSKWSSALGTTIHLTDRKQEIEPTDYACGCAFFLRVNVVKTVGLMDPRYFLNFEETDWCFRMRRFGFESLYVPQALVWHKICRSFIGRETGSMKHYFMTRNKLLWMEMNLSAKEYLGVVWRIIIPRIFLNILLSFKKNQDAITARASLRGIRDYLFRRFGPCPSYMLKLSSNEGKNNRR